jgi:hypothetical protein
MPKSSVLPPGRLRLNVSSQLDLCKAMDGRQTVCGPGEMRSSGVPVRDQTQNLFIEHTQIPIN